MAYASDFSDTELCTRAQAGDVEAMEAMLERYSPMADAAAKSGGIHGQSYDDLYSLATEALIKAVRHYKPGPKSFAYVAMVCVRRRFASAARAAKCRVSLYQHKDNIFRGAGIDYGNELKWETYEEKIIDPSSFKPFDGVEIQGTIIDIRLALTLEEQPVFDVMLARGGLADEIPDEIWPDVAKRLGQHRTSLWRLVQSIRAKALGVIDAS